MLLQSTLGAAEVEKEGQSLRTARGGCILPAGSGHPEGFGGLKITWVNPLSWCPGESPGDAASCWV